MSCGGREVVVTWLFVDMGIGQMLLRRVALLTGILFVLVSDDVSVCEA